MQDNKNILTATILSAFILISWTWFYEKPRIEQAELEAKKSIAIQDASQAPTKEKGNIYQNSQNQIDQQQNSQKVNDPIISSPEILLPREDVIENSKKNRVQIITPKLKGSINLVGAVFDDIILEDYYQDLGVDSGKVIYLSPKGSKNQHWFDVSFKVNNPNIESPDHNTVWKASSDVLTPENPITLSWKSPQNIAFNIHLAIDKDYMLSLAQVIINSSGEDIFANLNGQIVKSLDHLRTSIYILHEGPIGVFDNILNEVGYDDFEDQEKYQFSADTGWFGITDKYWITSIAPDKNANFSGQIDSFKHGNESIYNVSYATGHFKVSNNSKAEFNHHIFIGPKKASLLDEYSKKYDINSFDKAIDFGWFYFLTKPFFFILQFLNKILGNYGLAILAMTVLIKLLLFPLANKSYGAIARIKKLQPQIDEIRKKFKDEKMRMNKEIMELYKREKVNPASGCLPMLVQIPIFFSLYKVLYVTIDMRHAPFYGWIKDLSAPDPTSIFNLFGALPFEVSGIFVIGIWPILMGLSMLIQQKLNPQPTDPIQAKVMKLLPLILIFAFSHFPSGLVIYWTWSNILSILQQWFITKKLNKG